MRVAAAAKFGEMLTHFVPESEYDGLASGRVSLKEVVPPHVHRLFHEAAVEFSEHLPKGLLVGSENRGGGAQAALTNA